MLARRSVLVGLAGIGGITTLSGFSLFGFGGSKTPIYSNDGIAIDGSDAVAYFTEGRPVAGKDKFSTELSGATWLFASAENRDKFIADPEAFAPQYGGYCAWAMADGNLASTIPEAWDIVDGKLYLNFNADIQNRWRQDIPGYIARADQQWPEVVASLVG